MRSRTAVQGLICETYAVATIAIVQARMTSTRFPGKVLDDLSGQPMVIRQLERISRASKLDQIVLATSADPSDNQLAQIVADAGYRVFRGDLNDVLSRFIGVIDEYQPDVVVRLTADCPLTSPALIDQIISEFHNHDVDYASNTLTPTYPDGLDVEVVKATVLREVARSGTDPAEREHVTLGVYRHPEKYQLRNFQSPLNLGNYRWTVDTPEDMDFVRAIYAELFPTNESFDVEEILAYLERHPERIRTDQDAVRNAALQGIDTGAMNVQPH